MDVDLRDVLREQGLTGVARAILVDWWKLDEFAACESSDLILAQLRRDETVRRLPFPQDRILPAHSDRTFHGCEVIAVENQFIWEAVFASGSDEPTVEFFVGMEPYGELGPRLCFMPLDAFLVRVLAEAAVFSAEPQLRAVPNRGTRSTFQVLPRFAVDNTVVFPAVVGGRGWFGLLSEKRLRVATQDDPVVLARAGVGYDWECLVAVRQGGSSRGGRQASPALEWAGAPCCRTHEGDGVRLYMPE